jgi:hypothetical protein
MGSLRLHIQVDNKYSTLKADEVANEHISTALTGMFQVFNVSLPASAITYNRQVSLEPNIAYLNHSEPAKEKSESVKTQAETKAATLTVTEEDYVYVSEDRVPAIPEGAPDYIKTGIKMKNGVPHYKLRYICPKCDYQANIYVPEGTQMVDCYHCKTTMQAKKAVPGYGLSPDPFKNYYVAGDQKPIKVVTLEHYQKLRHRNK